MAVIYAVHLEQMLHPEWLDKAAAHLPQEVRLKAARYRAEQDARREIVSAVLKRVVACERTGIAVDQVQFTKNDYGKPSLKGYPDFHFNISHSADWVVCAVSTEGPIGVDIEQIGEAEDEVARLCFTHTELERWRHCPADLRDGFFYELWTLKESYVKAIGMGLSVPLSSIGTEKYGDGYYISCNKKVDTCRYMKSMSIDDEYACSVCVPAEDGEILFQNATMNEIFISFMELVGKHL
ncbi:4'-phosphopantetheinyl transferase family protein [Paenibacillus sp. SAF-054]|uniref:4'-phosphopantetheinyl transferase family protein n=1 Tax=unclassified Paenibacillus TaxID=185978 RepID=UPI003F80FB71